MAATASHGPVMANTSSLKEKPMAVRTANIIAARGVLPSLSLDVFGTVTNSLCLLSRGRRYQGIIGLHR